MDDCSRLLLQGHGDGTASERGYGSTELNEEQVLQQQLKKIYMMMDAEEDGYAEAVPSSSSSSKFHSISGSTTSLIHHPAEVSSLEISASAPPVVADDDNHHGLFLENLDMMVDLDELMTSPTQEAHQEQAQRKIGLESHGAFGPYVQNLGPRRQPSSGGCVGQRAIKAAMSALERMHMARFAQWQQSYQLEMAPPPPPLSTTGSNCGDQLQHILSERKRREKLKDSFKALWTVLPPGSKKDRVSTLIGARDYVNTLKSRVSELEEENKALAESHCQKQDYPDYLIEVSISRSVAEETSHEFRLKTVVGSGCNAMDSLITILQSLKDLEDVTLVAIDTDSTGGFPPGKNFRIATITLQLTSNRCHDKFLKESVIKIVKDAMKSDTVTT